MPTRNLNLTEHDEGFVEASIAADRFGSPSEAVGAALHLLEREGAEDQVRIESLRAAAQKGIDALDRGDYTTLRSRAEIGSFVRSAGSTRP